MLNQIQPTGKRQKIACGDALYLFVEPSHRSKTGSKGFVGITRFPPTKDGKQVETRIGMYGKGFNQWSLSGAREEWNRLRTERKLKGISPREVQISERVTVEPKVARPTIQEAVKGWMKRNPNWSKATRLDYERRCFNQILNPEQGGFSPDTSIDDFSWRIAMKEGKMGAIYCLSYNEELGCIYGEYSF